MVSVMVLTTSLLRRARRAAYKLGHLLTRFERSPDDEWVYAATCQWCSGTVLVTVFDDARDKGEDRPKQWASGPPLTHRCKAVSQ